MEGARRATGNAPDPGAPMAGGGVFVPGLRWPLRNQDMSYAPENERRRAKTSGWRRPFSMAWYPPKLAPARVMGLRLRAATKGTTSWTR